MNSPLDTARKLYESSLCEMALVNSNETRNTEFPFSNFRVYVIGEDAAFKFPHFHMMSISDGWDIRVNMDGSIHSIKVKGKNMQNESDFPKIERLLRKWLPKSHTYAFGKMSHLKYIKAMWNDNNPTALQVPL